MRISGFLDAVIERVAHDTRADDDEHRSGAALDTVSAPDGTKTIVPVNDALETRLETKYRTDAWITTDRLYSLDEKR